MKAEEYIKGKIPGKAIPKRSIIEYFELEEDVIARDFNIVGDQQYSFSKGNYLIKVHDEWKGINKEDFERIFNILGEVQDLYVFRK